MKKSEFDQLLELMAQSWTNRDYERVAAFFAEKLFYSDALNYSFSNKSELLKFFEDDEGCEQKCRFHLSVFDEEKQLGAAEYTYEGTHRYHGTVWIKIENDKIVEWREYQHTSDLDRNSFWKR